MALEREGGRGANQLRPIDCTRNILSRAHGSASCSHGETRVLAAVFGPKAGTKKNENPEKACIEVIWKAKTGQSGKPEKELEMVLKRTLQNICLLNVHPNTTTSIIVQVVHDDGSLLPCAIHAACAALVDAGIPLKYLAVAISCCIAENGQIILDPSKLEEQKMKAFVCLAFPGSARSVVHEGSANGIITSVTRGVMAVDDYLQCIEQGRSAITPLSNILKKKLQSQATE
ncbi:Ribosomal protein S5 domain 2-like superfamily protein [Striga hermonthica]|uniref:Ribosomal protein S5 domain 2-like superfamily protein n=1 Tax=Striga hermonthica TaxID=68872 RepID=A0A9N7RRG9_STRHE|nr:Ribosomal protein S5 domain 2-like superfamily protein [Striga hermonthica]